MLLHLLRPSLFLFCVLILLHFSQYPFLTSFKLTSSLIFSFILTVLFETVIFSPVGKCNDLEQPEINSMHNSLTEVNSP